MVASDSIIPKGLISDENSNLPTFILGFYLFKYTPNEYPNFSAFMLQYVFFDFLLFFGRKSADA